MFAIAKDQGRAYAQLAIGVQEGIGGAFGNAEQKCGHRAQGAGLARLIGAVNNMQIASHLTSQV